MIEPLVSVLVTSFNHEEYIEQTLRSVLKQTYRRLEIVVSDDGSRDRTAEIIRRAAAEDPRVVALCAPENQGMSANWNRAISRCSGEFVATLSGDDLMLPEKIERQVAFLQAHPECGVCTHDMEVFDTRTGATLYRLNDRFARKDGGHEVMFTTNWLFGREIKSIPSSHMFRAAAIGPHRFDLRLRMYNEWLHEIDCMVTSGLRWGSLPEALGRYRVHDRQSSRSDEAVRLGLEEILMVLAIAASRYPDLGTLIKAKRDFTLFRHLVFDWLPADRRGAYGRQLRIEAGWMKWAYMHAVRYVVHHGWLLEATRPTRRVLKRALR